MKHAFDLAKTSYDQAFEALRSHLGVNLETRYPNGMGLHRTIQVAIETQLNQLDQTSPLPVRPDSATQQPNRRWRLYLRSRTTPEMRNMLSPSLNEQMDLFMATPLMQAIEQLDNAVVSYQNADRALQRANLGWGDLGDSSTRSPNGHYRWDQFVYQTFERPWDPGVRPAPSSIAANP